MEAENSKAGAEERTHLGISRRLMTGGFAGLLASLSGTGAARAGSTTKTYRPDLSRVDYVTTDSPYYDGEYPATDFGHTFMSEGAPIQSFMWLASGREAKGCVIISPQRGGGDSGESLIPPLTNAGIHVLKFYPHGMWFGKYRWISALEAVHAAVAHLRENGGLHSAPMENGGRPYQIDLDKIAVIGKSGGGGMLGWIANSENPGIRANIALSPAPVPPQLGPEYQAIFAESKARTAGRVDLYRELTELSAKDRDRLDMYKATSRLVDKYTLLIGDPRPDYAKGTHWPLVEAMESAGAKHFSQAILERTGEIARSRLVVSWLKSEAGF